MQSLSLSLVKVTHLLVILDDQRREFRDTQLNVVRSLGMLCHTCD